MTLQLKVDFKASVDFVKVSTKEPVNSRVDGLKCVHGSADDFSGRTTNWNSNFSHPVLRANRPSSAGATIEWTATLRLDGTVPVGNHSAGAPARLYLD